MDSDDESQIDLSEEQRREHEEVVQMVRRIEAAGWKVTFEFREYDRTWFIQLAGDRCYRSTPKAHAYLSGAMAIAEARWHKELN